jgi:hypothetical protein
MAIIRFFHPHPHPPPSRGRVYNEVKILPLPWRSESTRTEERDGVRGIKGLDISVLILFSGEER